MPVVVTRDAEGSLHGFVNVCRHRAHPVALKDGCRKLLQCRYHGWTYTLDGRLQNAPRASREMEFDKSELSLIPIAVDTWRGFVFVNPDASAPPLRDVHPALEPLAVERNLGFADWTFQDHWVYDIPANWKVFVENAVECYHCPTVHTNSFSDAFVTDANVYELVETGRPAVPVHALQRAPLQDPLGRSDRATASASSTCGRRRSGRRTTRSRSRA